MKIKHFILLALLISFAFACKNDAKKEAVSVDEKEVKKTEIVEKKSIAKEIAITMEAKSNSEVKGKALISQKGDQVQLMASFYGLTPGTHAIHLHEKADCSSADGKSTGGHWNPTFESHGAWGAETGFHRGDIGNFEVSENGTGIVDFKTDLWCIGCEDEKKNILGKAIIVHQGVDDLTSQPSGAAGARVSCGGIIE